MEKPIYDGKELDIDFEIKDGKVAIIAKHDGSGGGADVKLYAKADYFLDKLAAAIPGEVDDTIIAVLKAALLK